MGLLDGILDTTVKSMGWNDVYKNISSIISSNTGQLNAGKQIFGAPFRFNTHTDPYRYNYTKTFISDGPIMTIIPGKPKFRKSIEQIRALLLTKDEGKVSSKNTGGSTIGSYNDNLITNKITMDLDSDEKVANWLLLSQKNNDANFKGFNNSNIDLRYYHFEADYKSFQTYLDLMLYTLAAKMNIADLTNTSIFSNITSSNFLNEYFSGLVYSGNSYNHVLAQFMDVTRGLRFYANKSLGSSQSLNNSYGESMLASQAKSMSSMAREALFLLGQDLPVNVQTAGGAQKEAQSNFMSSVSKAVSGVFSVGNSITNGALSDIEMGIQATITGANLIYPLIWQDSKFSKSYSASFTFTSPYGTPEAIFQYVYLPFCILLALACPRQVGGSTAYAAPMILKIDAPGHFTSDLAAISDMSWTIGGNDQYFSKDGLPLSITCNVSFIDLYPCLMLSENWGLMRQNTGMFSMLDNMSGLAMNRITPLDDWMASVQTKTNYLLSSGRRSLVTGTLDSIYNFTYKDLKSTLGI